MPMFVLWTWLRAIKKRYGPLGWLRRTITRAAYKGEMEREIRTLFGAPVVMASTDWLVFDGEELRAMTAEDWAELDGEFSGNGRSKGSGDED